MLAEQSRVGMELNTCTLQIVSGETREPTECWPDVLWPVTDMFPDDEMSKAAEPHLVTSELTLEVQVGAGERQSVLTRSINWQENWCAPIHRQWQKFEGMFLCMQKSHRVSFSKCCWLRSNPARLQQTTI